MASTLPQSASGPDNHLPIVSGDQPPAYNNIDSVPIEDTANGKNHRPSSKRYIRLCPHQTLSFSRFQHITRLKDIKTTLKLYLYKRLPTAHHTRCPKNATMCTTQPTKGKEKPLIFSPASSTIIYHSGPGFVVQTVWQLNFDRQGSVQNSKDTITKMLDASKVWLCPHTKLSDTWIVDAFYGLLHPGARYDDPIDQYEFGDSNSKECRQCKTKLRVYRWEEVRGNHDGCCVKVIRSIGNGEVENDPLWLQQRALPKNEPTPLARIRLAVKQIPGRVLRRS